MRPADIDAIIFDCDGVLVDSEAITMSVERELLAEPGLQYEPEPDATRFIGLSDQDYREALGADDARVTGGGAFSSDFSATVHARVWPRILRDL
ncbi:MAG: HAD hydrolase-like protein, partial [Pseudomonadota bacterium]